MGNNITTLTTSKKRSYYYSVCAASILDGLSQNCKIASEKEMVSNLAAKVGLVLFGGCILVPISLVTLSIYYAVPLQTLTVLFSVDSASRDSDQPLCDFSSSRSNVCEMKGDVRITPRNATVVFLHPFMKQHQQWRIKPHPRKKDGHALAAVTEVSITSTPDAARAPECTARHAAPAVVFSVGGYAGNMFHDFTDVLVPLFITVARFRGDVHLLAGDAPPWWVAKYRPLLRELSRHDIVGVGGEGEGAGGEVVHCYTHLIVGLRFHKEMSVDAGKTAGGYSMADFAKLVRRSYGLKRSSAIHLGGRDGTHAVKSLHPRLLLIARKATRAFTNVGAIRRAAAAVGFEVVVGEPEQGAAAATAFAATVNSCDVLVGVHGAGLANLVFLPARAVVVQVVPLGGLEEAAREDFGEPAGDMELGYVQYDIAVNESSLVARYPRDHRVLKDPPAVRRDGWLALRAAYLVGQNVTLNVTRFRAPLLKALDLLHR